MRRLVIGCGYLGQRVARTWQQQGDEVWAVTRSADRARDFANQGWKPIIADAMRPASLADLPACETLCYAVGLDRGSGYSQRDVYVSGLANVLRGLAGRANHIVYISSTSVYGQNAGEWVDETSPCLPVSANGQVCLEAEQVLTGAARPVAADSALTAAGSPLSTCVLRLSGIYGPGRLAARIDDLKSGRLLTGRPDAWLNLIHVDDAAQAVLAVADEGTTGVVLVSDDEPVVRQAYYARLAKLVGAPPPRLEESGPSEGLNKRCNNRRLREELRVQLTYPSIWIGLPQALAEKRDAGTGT